MSYHPNEYSNNNSQYYNANDPYPASNSYDQGHSYQANQHGSPYHQVQSHDANYSHTPQTSSHSQYPPNRSESTSSNLTDARSRALPASLSNHSLLQYTNDTTLHPQQPAYSPPHHQSHPQNWDPANSYDNPAAAPIYDPAPQPGFAQPGRFQADSAANSIDLGSRETTAMRNYNANPNNGHYANNQYPLQHQGSYYPAEDEKSVFSKHSANNNNNWSTPQHSTLNLNQPAFPPQPAYGAGYGIPDPMFSSGGLGQAGFVIAAPPPMIQPQYRNPAQVAENREKIMRKRTVKRVELQNGNLVVDVPVAKSISRSDANVPEFREMRYQAVTCDPDDFIAERYTLRPWLYGRQCEMAIVLTSYNEDDVLFARTMGGVIKNIAHLCGRTRSKTWGADAWKKVVVIIVADGRKKANDRMLKSLGLMGCYNEGVMKDHVLKKPVEAHVFEYTTRVQVTEKGEVQVTPCPIQVVFCLKEQNKKKLNSHRWFFNSFCQLLKPNVCVLLDVGTKPTGTSIYQLWKSFDKHSNVGGACGEICVDTGRGCLQLANPLVASQNFEYKMSNILDKPTESIFGFISVLPGAFSAYRYKALLGRPLEMYFKGEKLHSGEGGNSIFSGNMYLAEDRILCFELVTKAREGWLLRYVKSAKAYTDVPDRVPEFISQRRRWLNGSLFASYHAAWHWYRIWSSGQNFFRKLWLMVQVIYNIVQLVFSWFALANFFLAFFFLLSSATSSSEHDAFGGQGQAITEIFQNIFISMIVVVLVCSLGNRPQGSNFAYTSAIVIFAIIMGLALYCAGFTTYLALDAAGLTHKSGWTGKNIEQLFKTSGFRDIVISLAATYVLYLVSSLLHFEPWHMLTSFIQYLFLTPTYIIVLSIYSMCNTNDLSWGTKQQTGPNTDLGGVTAASQKDGKDQVELKIHNSAEDAELLWRHYRETLSVPEQQVHQKRDKATRQEDHARNFRTNLVLMWIGTNALIVIIFTSKWWNNFVAYHLYANKPGPIINPYQSVIFWVNAGLAAVRAFGSIVYLILRLFGH